MNKKIKDNAVTKPARTLDEIYREIKDVEDAECDLADRKELLLKEKKRAFAVEMAKRGEIIWSHIDALIAISKHNRTSCSDAVPCNCGGDNPCSRCQLIYMKRTGDWDTFYDVEILVRRSTWNQD